jgi:probable F420-dependent oxidoreductase
MTTTTRIGISMPMLNLPADRYPELARLADDAGFDSLWTYEFYRNPFVTLAGCARATQRIQLCTGIAAATARTPNEMAQAAADVDEISNGRMVLGVGIGGSSWAEFYNGTDIHKPLSRVREYVSTMRAIWEHHASGQDLEQTGAFYSAASPPFNAFGLRQHQRRHRIPTYIGGVGPKMLQMGGEVADGVLGFVVTPEFVRDYMIPMVEQGARRAGRSPSEVDVAALVLCSVSDDREVALRRARINVGMYVAYPGAERMVEFAGLTADREKLIHALMSEGPAALETATSDDLVRAFSICGTPDEAREQLAAYDGILPHIVLHTPYVPPICADDSEDAFRQTVRTFGTQTTA